MEKNKEPLIVAFDTSCPMSLSFEPPPTRWSSSIFLPVIFSSFFTFNAYFKAGFEILPDKNYIFKDEKHSYDFIDVTDKISE